MTVPSGANFQDRVIDGRLYGLLLRGPGMATPKEVVGQLTAMQAQDHTYARWSVAQRMAGAPGKSAVDTAFDDGHFLRTHILRPTWHYVAASDLWWLMRLSGPRVDAATTRQYESVGLDARSLSQSVEVIHLSVADGPKDTPGNRGRPRSARHSNCRPPVDAYLDARRVDRRGLQRARTRQATDVRRLRPTRWNKGRAGG